ncbi:MAG: hypothetical protein K0Q79_1567 [Flavipsychrobacter sp.]|jgi:hypothetical protein|nr:hypothetical protein [Flavipsychrobacter sp.]
MKQYEIVNGWIKKTEVRDFYSSKIFYEALKIASINFIEVSEYQKPAPGNKELIIRIYTDDKLLSFSYDEKDRAEYNRDLLEIEKLIGLNS